MFIGDIIKNDDNGIFLDLLNLVLGTLLSIILFVIDHPIFCILAFFSVWGIRVLLKSSEEIEPVEENESKAS